jgi:hypothetical protein
LPQEVQSLYDERYLKSLGTRPTHASLAPVSKLTVLADHGIKLRLRKVGYRQDDSFTSANSNS